MSTSDNNLSQAEPPPLIVKSERAHIGGLFAGGRQYIEYATFLTDKKFHVVSSHLV
jgi:hypothetical protein